MKILAIETSCDETAAAVVEDGWKVLSNVIASSLDLHKKTGGVVPEIAARAQMEFIIPVLDRALKKAFPKKTGRQRIALIDAIAVTSQPGLVTSLLVGIETAKWLSYLWNKPLIRVNHIHGHVYANWLGVDTISDPILFPVLSLSVSGGHNELMLIDKEKEIRVLGESQDDSAGEAFDKVARVLGLGYPGGPEIEKLAKKHSHHDLYFPRAWLNQNPHLKTWDGKNFNFSFSGLKSEVMREVQRGKRKSSEIADAFQKAVFDVLVTKLIGAAKKFKAKEIHIAGGVSANKRFRSLIKERIKKEKLLIPFRCPKKMIYCTDNAAMIGAAAFLSQSPRNFSVLGKNQGEGHYSFSGPAERLFAK